MANVKAVGEKEEAAKKKALILEVLGIVFAFIPFLDDLTPEIELLVSRLFLHLASSNSGKEPPKCR